MPDIELTYNQPAVDALVKEAVEKERERCAAIAEKRVAESESLGLHGLSRQLLRLSAEIRAAPPQGEK